MFQWPAHAIETGESEGGYGESDSNVREESDEQNHTCAEVENDPRNGE